MGYSNKNVKKKGKDKKISIFSCYSNVFDQIKRLKCDFFIKRILFKSLISMIQNQNHQVSFSWLSIIDEWSDLCESKQESKNLQDLIRKMKVLFIDRQISQKKNNRTKLSAISKLLFARYFLGMLQLEQQSHIHLGLRASTLGALNN